MIKNLMTFAALVVALVFNAACTTPTTQIADNANSTNVNAANANVAVANANQKTEDEEIPAAVKAVFADAQSVTMQHKDLTAAQIKEIKDEMKVAEVEDHFHAYPAFKTENGTRKQIGSATHFKFDGKDVVIIYENKSGEPHIKEIRTDAAPADFIKQFAGKGHDDKLQIGQDLKANGADAKTAASLSEKIRVDVMTMAMLFGSHKH